MCLSPPRSFGFRLALGLMAGLLFTVPTMAADHRDGPKISDRNGDLGALDLNDLYVFRSPNHPDHSVFIMTMSPGAGIVGPSFFFPGAVYELHISNDGNDLDLTELVFRIVFTGPNNTGRQGYTVTQLNDRFETRVLAQGVTNSRNGVKLRGGGTVTAGIFDDPFFFDANAVARVNRELTLKSMGIPIPGVPPGANPVRWLFPPSVPNNFFGGFNTLAIVFELPRFRVQSSMGNSNIAVWERVVANAGDGRGFAQYDRTAIPAINTVVVPLSRTIDHEVLPNGLQDQFNYLYPSDDVKLRPIASHRLQTVFGLPTATANSLVNALLPDLLHFDTTSSEGFPNGRRLKDDVVDIELGLLTNGAVTSDRVFNDSYFRAGFPYLGAPNPVETVLRNIQIQKHMTTGGN